jgi:hypothetical protein
MVMLTDCLMADHCSLAAGGLYIRRKLVFISSPFGCRTKGDYRSSSGHSKSCRDDKDGIHEMKRVAKNSLRDPKRDIRPPRARRNMAVTEAEGPSVVVQVIGIIASHSGC